jgi:hypothetical protein
MDDELLGVFEKSLAGPKYKDVGQKVEFTDFAAGQISIKGSGEAQPYTLKPLKELYGDGTGFAPVDPEDDIFMPLFLAIEDAIARYYQLEKPDLTDGSVGLVLDQMGMDPESNPTDPLAVRIRVALRMCLSINNYSRQEVKAALKKVYKSVDRHTRAAGRRGYLDFVVQFFGPKRK